jgi:hypothetical protein
MTTEEFRQFLALADDREAKRYAWLRQLLVISSGALTALVAFRAGAQSVGLALLFLRIAWVALGLGILLGALSLHAEVWTAAELVRLASQQARERSSSGATGPSPVVAKRPGFYRWAERLFYLCLIVAVISLVSHAVLRN